MEAMQGSMQSKIVIEHYKKVYIYNLDKHCIEKTYKITNNTYLSPAATIIRNNLILVFQKREKYSIQKLNLKTGIFEKIPPPVYQKALSSVVALNGYLYVIGGVHFSSTYYRYIERFDFNRSKWSKLADMAKNRFIISSAVLKDKIFVAGGCNTQRCKTRTLQCYNTSTNSWSLCAPMLHKRIGFSMVTANKSLFAFGGWYLTFLKDIEKYDSENDTWTQVSQLEKRYNVLSTCLVGSKIIVVGARKENTPLYMEEFDPLTYECNLIDRLPIMYQTDWNLSVLSYND